jgi:metal-responsive CopG/Arc/MetJ family transcriptional regulator
MKTIQMTLDEELLYRVDQIIKKLNKTRSEFIREALNKSLSDIRIREMEKRHREGYMKKPIEPGEFDLLENEQVWV